jgi:hypothetical protein
MDLASPFHSVFGAGNEKTKVVVSYNSTQYRVLHEATLLV